MINLTHPKKLEVKTSNIHGYGVFATDDIKQGEIVEDCYIIKIPLKRGFMPQMFIDYKFKWQTDDGTIEEVLPLGFGCIYNHSDNYNVTWRQITERKIIQFYAVKDIKKGEEVCHWYGNKKYWETKEKLKNI
jgi:SET domain-containing protein